MHCPRPFEQFYVTSDGNVHLCCPEWMDSPVGNLLETSPLDIWHSELAKQMRAAILDQSFKHCTRCPLLPGPSGCVVDESPPEPSTARIRNLTVAYDPTCNLTCPSCRSEVRGKDDLSEHIQRILLDSGIFAHVDRLCSSGSGDPLAAPLYWELLKALPASQYPDLRLVLQTNGILLNERTWQRLGENAQRIDEILLSIDAAGPETYAKNRRGGDWNVLMRNLDGIAKRQIPLQINMVVQQNNFREMPAFLALGKAFGVVRCYFSAVQNWGTYSKDDYLKRAVHLPEHPEYPELLSILDSPTFKDLKSVTLAGLPRPENLP